MKLIDNLNDITVNITLKQLQFKYDINYKGEAYFFYIPVIHNERIIHKKLDRLELNEAKPLVPAMLEIERKLLSENNVNFGKYSNWFYINDRAFVAYKNKLIIYNKNYEPTVYSSKDAARAIILAEVTSSGSLTDEQLSSLTNQYYTPLFEELGEEYTKILKLHKLYAKEIGAQIVR